MNDGQITCEHPILPSCLSYEEGVECVGVGVDVFRLIATRAQGGGQADDLWGKMREALSLAISKQTKQELFFSFPTSYLLQPPLPFHLLLSHNILLIFFVLFAEGRANDDYMHTPLLYTFHFHLSSFVIIIVWLPLTSLRLSVFRLSKCIDQSASFLPPSFFLLQSPKFAA